MASAPTILKGVVHGKIIELEVAPGLPDGQAVAVAIERIEERKGTPESGGFSWVEKWADRLVFDSALSGERIVKGTQLSAERLTAELEAGRSDEEMLRAHSELTREDVEALRHYARAPVGLRRSFGAWAEDATELDEYLEWTRQQRKIGRREIEE